MGTDMFQYDPEDPEDQVDPVDPIDQEGRLRRQDQALLAHRRVQLVQRHQDYQLSQALQRDRSNLWALEERSSD